MTSSGNPNAGHRKRLKERFMKSSLEGFHDYEILELLLTFAIPRRDVKPLAKGLLRRFKGLKGVFEAPLEELGSISGIGENAGLLITLLKEAAGAYLKEEAQGVNALSCPKDVVEFLNARLSGAREESFLAIYLNSKNEVLGLETLHEGAIKRMTVSPRDVLGRAFGHNARSVIFVHRHQGAALTSEPFLRKLMKDLADAASPVDIIVHDLIIIGKDRHFSARDSGWLKGA